MIIFIFNYKIYFLSDNEQTKIGNKHDCLIKNIQKILDYNRENRLKTISKLNFIYIINYESFILHLLYFCPIFISPSDGIPMDSIPAPEGKILPVFRFLYEIKH